MDLQNIQDQLNTEFAKESTRVIFWFDDKGEYEDEVAELQLDNASLHVLDGTNWLYTKWLLHEQDTESKYLIYAPFSKPSDAENPLADMYYYSMLYIKKEGLTPELNQKIIEIRKSNVWNSIDEKDSTSIRQVFDNEFPKNDVKAVLIHEQKGLCAYCMKRIRMDRHSRVEHLIPLSADKEKAIDYNNLLGVCDGGEQNTNQQGHILCCDAHKAEELINISPLNRVQMEKIAYKPDGTIYTDPQDEIMENDINEILLLNGIRKVNGSVQDTATEILKGRRDAYDRARRMIPLVENNYNLCELGPRSTGKSYIYEQISPNSILVAGGQTTVANLFYNMSNNTVGLVGMWDCVAFDEVAGIKFKDKDGIQIMKGYMASGSFSRSKAEIQAKASMVFVGNINQSVETLLKTSNLFDPFLEIQEQ